MKIIKVGRSSGNEIVIADPYVGKTHCEFIQDNNGDYWVVDMNSRNGTYVNGVRRSGKTKLNKNDIVRIGNTPLTWMNYFAGVTGGITDMGTHYMPDPPIDNSSKGNGFGITALVCGILGLSVFAIVFGAIAMNRKEKNRGLGVAGLVLGIVWAAFAIVIWAILIATA
jgi:hypothetical protein